MTAQPTSKIRDASTVLLIRENGPSEIEVFMTRRPKSMVFLGGFHVFPGGRVDMEDAAPEALEICRGLTPERAREALGNAREPGQSLAHYVAAVRELFEEVGILLAYKGDALVGDLFTPAEGPELEAIRSAMEDGDIVFADFMREHQLECALDQLRYFSHWITPPGPPRRFDTRFFLAKLPPGQEPSPHATEVEECVWITPADALCLHEKGEMQLIPPTIASLRTLTDHAGLDELFTAFPA